MIIKYIKNNFIIIIFLLMDGHLIGSNRHNQMGIQLCTKDIIVSCVPKVGKKNFYFLL